MSARYYAIITRDDGSRTYKGPLGLPQAVAERNAWVTAFPTYEASVQLVDDATKADVREWTKWTKGGGRYFPTETVEQMIGVEPKETTRYYAISGGGESPLTYEGPLDPQDPGVQLVADFERSACPACGDPDCQFPPACQQVVNEPSSRRPWPHHDEDDDS